MHDVKANKEQPFHGTSQILIMWKNFFQHHQNIIYFNKYNNVSYGIPWGESVVDILFKTTSLTLSVSAKKTLTVESRRLTANSLWLGLKM